MPTTPNLTLQQADPFGVEADWLIVPAVEGDSLSPSVAALDVRLGGLVQRLRQTGDITGKANEAVPLLSVTGIAARRVLVIGLGKRSEIDRSSLHDAAAAAARAVTGKANIRIAAMLPDGVPIDDAVLAFGVGLVQGGVGPGLRKATPIRFTPEEIVLIAAPGTDSSARDHLVRRAAAEGRAVALARELVNTPPCDLYPESFADRTRQLAGAGIECTVLDEVAIRGERMGALLGIAQGSDRPPRVVVYRYRGGPASRTLGLVGKGVTFDSGGLSIKTNEQMADMKCDMAGAAAVLGALTVIAELKLPVNVLGVMALVENMPSGRAVKL
ncbi:MAG TPA: M17 family peptidase N-terminal domain-containing protein, partial [Gemmataceae bacterium]|nr:M17 family peptidase N-terminal domain-containing protein [Gemmataceae bacterium]